MTAGDLAAVIVSFISIATVVALILVVQHMQRTVRRMSDTVEQLRAEAMPVIEELQSSVRRTNDDLDRVDDLIGSAEAITTTVEGASRLAYLTVSKPVIKTMALAAGTQRAARRLRGEPSVAAAPDPPAESRRRPGRRRRAG